MTGMPHERCLKTTQWPCSFSRLLTIQQVLLRATVRHEQQYFSVITMNQFTNTITLPARAPSLAQCLQTRMLNLLKVTRTFFHHSILRQIAKVPLMPAKPDFGAEIRAKLSQHKSATVAVSHVERSIAGDQ